MRPGLLCSRCAPVLVLATTSRNGSLAVRPGSRIRGARPHPRDLVRDPYMIHTLKPGDRCGVIMPEGVQFGSAGARHCPQISTSAPSSTTWSGGIVPERSAVLARVIYEGCRVVLVHSDRGLPLGRIRRFTKAIGLVPALPCRADALPPTARDCRRETVPSWTTRFCTGEFRPWGAERHRTVSKRAAFISRNHLRIRPLEIEHHHEGIQTVHSWDTA
jgi:hypothetical protein